MRVFLIEPENCSHDQNNAVAVFAESDVKAMLLVEEMNKSSWKQIFEEDQRPMKITELDQSKERVILISSNAG
jgi:hypothetical protein